MAAFHGGSFERRSKESRPDDSPYHIFTPDNTTQFQDDTAATCTFSTFLPQVKHQGSTTNMTTSFTASLPQHIQHHTSIANTENSFSSSLPRHGSHGSTTTTVSTRVHRHRSTDNVATSFGKGLPPRSQYQQSPTNKTSSFTKSLPPRKERHGSIPMCNVAESRMTNLPRHESATTTAGGGFSVSLPQPTHTLTSQTNDMECYKMEGDIDYPVNFSPEYDRLPQVERNITAPNVVHRNAAYESVVRRPSNESGRHNSPIFDIEVGQEEYFQTDAIERGLLSNPQAYGSGTNFFEMCSDDGSRVDLNTIKTPSPQRLKDYENVKEYIPSNMSELASSSQFEPKLSNMEGKDPSGSCEQGSEQWNTDNPGAYQYKSDYENLKEYTNMEHDDNPQWIPLAAVPKITPCLSKELDDDLEWSPTATVPKIVVEDEPSSINKNPNKDQDEGQPELDIHLLGKDLRKSADLETLSDYEEMVSSFSSHYTAVKSNQQHPFPFLSSTELEGAQGILHQEDNDKQDVCDTNPMGDTCTQGTEQACSEPTRNKPSRAPKKKKAKCFQYCLIFITLAIAIAALVMSILVYLKMDNNTDENMNNSTVQHS